MSICPGKKRNETTIYNDNKEIQKFESTIISKKKQYRNSALMRITLTLSYGSVCIKVRFAMKISFGKTSIF